MQKKLDKFQKADKIQIMQIFQDEDPKDKKIQLLQAKVDDLQDTLESLERLDRSLAPCGHNEQYCYSPDGVGKVVKCLLCYYLRVEHDLVSAGAAPHFYEIENPRDRI